MLEVVFEEQTVGRVVLKLKSSVTSVGDAEHLGYPLMSKTDEYMD
jgi:hypothetical protein